MWGVHFDEKHFRDLERAYDAMLVSRPAWLYRYWLVHRHWKTVLVCDFLNLYLGERSIMARGQKNVPAKPASGQWTQFVDISLTGTKPEAVSAAFPTSDKIDEAVVALLEAGYRLSFSYNSQTDAFICSVTCKAETSPNNGKTFNAFAGDWAFALQCALYKHFVVAKGVWGSPDAKTERPSFG